jgi:hypothetical protein
MIPVQVVPRNAKPSSISIFLPKRVTIVPLDILVMETTIVSPGQIVQMDKKW